MAKASVVRLDMVGQRKRTRNCVGWRDVAVPVRSWVEPHLGGTVVEASIHNESLGEHEETEIEQYVEGSYCK